LNVNQVEESLWDTVGLPIGETQVRIVHPNQEGIGELQVQAPWQMLGYYSTAEVNAWDDTQNGNGKWLNTGDLAMLTPEGYIRLQGRKKDLIISGGANISPAEIETALTDIPCVIEATVIGVPDRKRGEVPYAFVVCNGSRTAAEILAILRNQLDSIKIPKRIHFVNYIPRNATGKVDRFALLESHRNPRLELIEESA
jgi:acyl-CoA synthetase (AMP-forming)/AMP-acid ligase II